MMQFGSSTEMLTVSFSRCRYIYAGLWKVESEEITITAKVNTCRELNQPETMNWIFKKKITVASFLSFWSGVAEDSILLGYDAVSWGNWVMALYATEMLTPDYHAMQCHISEEWKPETEHSLRYL